ncbi:Putative L,D-transpeptidase LppS precursor [Mycobacterium basiliense]|uniref:L,D-transpeptidase LppS n=1 Tax=Mycobacterium basiliense TaxID=2094119 RepID=A0A3S4BEY4_9MYCO|nr:L,D-transpeptidase family protein [Mycobacterium basiliense]VDM86819.1 Putative L,D-transpeptidase LppS precursor [Mycobacterium basiliense]
MSRWTRGRTRGSLFAAANAAGVIAVLVLGTGPALADPDDAPGDPVVVAPAPPAPDPLAPPPGPDPLALPPMPDPLTPPPPNPLAVPAAAGPVAGQDPTPFIGPPPFRPPTFNPVDGAMVGVAKPIIINFEVPIADRPMAESAIHISSIPPVPGKFYWMSPTQVRWRPFEFWPANTAVNIDAAGTKSSFRTGDSLVATADDATHQMTISRNGVVQQTFPMSMGMAAGNHQTPNGTYYVLEKMPTVVMDSSTYGVPVNSPQGYKVTVSDAVRIDNSGNFVHSAPWSVGDQGKRDVSHGCINLSPSNAKWFYDNFGSGDPIVVKNSVGTYNKNDGAQDWQI